MSRRAQTVGNINVDIAEIRRNLTKVNPVLEATLRNAVARNGRNPERDELSGTNDKVVNQYKLEKLSNVISNNINAVMDLRAITPYIDKAESIWQTMLLYPNGRQEKIISRDTQPSAIKNAKMHAELLTLWDNYFTNDYKIEKDLKKIVSDLLINTGSYCLFNMSRTNLDYLINGSELKNKVTGAESFTDERHKAFNENFRIDGQKRVIVKNLGKFVRDPNTKENGSITGVEHIFGSSGPYAGDEFYLYSSDDDPEHKMGITLTDNMSALYLQKIHQARRKEDIRSVTGAESFSSLIDASYKDGDSDPTPKPDSDKLSKEDKKKKPADPRATTKNLNEKQLDEASSNLFRTRDMSLQFIQYVKPVDALSEAPYGRGLTFHVPSEAVIPIHFNGGLGKAAPDYIFLTDPTDGSFLKTSNDFEFYQSIGANKDKTANRPRNGSGNNLIQNLRRVQDGRECDFDMSEFAELSRSNLIRMFSQAVLSGRGENISIEIDEDVNKIFLQRMFRSQGVRCVYVPGEAVTYMALQYNRMGVGQSLVQQAKGHITRLAMLDLADMLATLEAATPHTLATVRLKERAPEPMNDIANFRNTFFESNPSVHNILMMQQFTVPQMVDAMRESSLTIKVDAGENPFFAQHDVDFGAMDRNNFKAPDQHSRDSILSSVANYLHLERSWLDTDSDQNNFQIEALAEHQMLLNRVVSWQEDLGGFEADFERKHVAVNQPVLKAMIAKIKENKSNWKPDSGFELEGSETQKIDLILTDFMNNIVCKFPSPSSVETTSKIKDSLDVVKDLVDKWMEIAGINGSLVHVAKLLGFQTDDSSGGDENDGSNSKDLNELKAQVRAVFLSEAFKRYNLPMPFDDIVSDGKGGGMASMVNSIVHQHQNSGEFLALMMKGLNETDSKIIKKHYKLIDKAVQELKDALAKVKGQGEPEEALQNVPPGGEVPGDDVNVDVTVDDNDNPTPEPEQPEEEEEEEEPSEEEEEGDGNKGTGDSGNDGTDPTKNDPDYQPFKP